MIIQAAVAQNDLLKKRPFAIFKKSLPAKPMKLWL